MDIAGTLAYYNDKLGFNCLGTWQDPPVYAIVARDQHAIHFRCAAPPTANPDKYADELLDAYIVVEDADALYAEYAAQGVEFTRGLGNMPWHTREFVSFSRHSSLATVFMVKDCDGRLLASARTCSCRLCLPVSGLCFTRLPAQILLYESRAEMHVHLEKRAIPDDFETVNLAGLDNENVPSATFKRLSVHGPYSAAFPDKLDLIVGMSMRPRTLARQPAEQKHGDGHISLLGADKFV